MKTRNDKTINRIVDGVMRDIHLISESAVKDELENLYHYLSQEATDNIKDKNGLNTNLKAFNYFEPKGIVYNQWALHFTHLEAWEDIQNNGFRNGTINLDHLAYSNHYRNPLNMETVTDGGWLFAIPISNKYLGEDCGYGDCGFLIRTDGVLAYHKGDGDDEIIFNNDCVKKSIPFMFDEDEDDWLLFNGQEHRDFNTIQELIHFVTKQ